MTIFHENSVNKRVSVINFIRSRYHKFAYFKNINVEYIKDKNRNLMAERATGNTLG